MIKAAIVGMGWWGRTWVEAVADSDSALPHASDTPRHEAVRHFLTVRDGVRQRHDGRLWAKKILSASVPQCVVFERRW